MRSLFLCLLLTLSVSGFSKINAPILAVAYTSGTETAACFASPIYTAASPLKLYATRSVSATVLTEIPKGAQVKVVDSRFGSWWQIQYKNKIGFTQSTYLKYSTINNRLDEDPIFNTSSLYNSKPTYVLDAEMELYEHPSTASAIQTKLPKGAKVKVIDSGNGSWWLVHYKGRTGNIRNADLNFSTQKPVQGPAIPVTKLSLVPKAKPTHATSSALSMREGMTHGSAILLEIPKGTAVAVINPNFGDWAQIEYRGKTGYVPSGYFTGLDNTRVETPISTRSAKSPGASITIYSLTKETSLRAAPDSQAKVLERFDVGDQVTILDNSGEWWWEVTFKGNRGWVKRHLLEAH